jgi:hypothetical protein
VLWGLGMVWAVVFTACHVSCGYRGNVQVFLLWTSAREVLHRVCPAFCPVMTNYKTRQSALNIKYRFDITVCNTSTVCRRNWGFGHQIAGSKGLTAEKSQRLKLQSANSRRFVTQLTKTELLFSPSFIYLLLCIQCVVYLTTLSVTQTVHSRITG